MNPLTPFFLSVPVSSSFYYPGFPSSALPFAPNFIRGRVWKWEKRIRDGNIRQGHDKQETEKVKERDKKKPGFLLVKTVSCQQQPDDRIGGRRPDGAFEILSTWSRA